jgi:hypothetical protein
MVHAALLLLMLEAYTRTSFHDQPEAQHPKSSAIHKLPADYPILGTADRDGLPINPLSGSSRHHNTNGAMSANDPKRSLSSGLVYSALMLAA